MRRSKSLYQLLVIVILSLVAGGYFIIHNYLSLDDKLLSSNTIVGQARVADGDSLVINKQRIRLINIDAPELKQWCKLDFTSDKEYACGQRSKEFLIKLINKQTVTCYSLKKDQYQRHLSHCFANNIDLNKTMVESGWAVSYGSYLNLEKKARAEKRGMWAYGPFRYPQTWRSLTKKRHNYSQ